MPTPTSFLRRLALASIAGILLALSACQVGDDKTENRLDLDRYFQTFAQFDSVVITVRVQDRGDSSVLFRGEVDEKADVMNLGVPNWDGGNLLIIISGYDRGGKEPRYREEKLYQPEMGRTDSTVIIHPKAGIAAPSLQVLLNEGQVVPLPRIEITPWNIADRSLLWQSADPAVVVVQDSVLKAGKRGAAKLTARMAYDTAKALVFEVVVQADPQVPDVLLLDRDTLQLAEGGAPGRIGIQVVPATASAEVTWWLADSSIAALRSDGSFQGLKIGRTLALAASRRRPSLMDSAVLVVVDPREIGRIDSVAASPDSVVLYKGGPGMVLQSRVYPTTASSQVNWLSLAPATAPVSASGEVLPLRGGSAAIVVRSAVDSAKADTVRVTVRVDVPTLAVGRDTVILQGSTVVFSPVAFQEFGSVVRFKWDPDGDGTWNDSATGLQPLSHAYPEAGEYQARFYVRDSEGNEAVATRRINSVKSSLVEFLHPADGAWTNQSVIGVAWKVDGKTMDSLLSERLKPGANVITRSGRDGAGSLATASITVHLDTVPPPAPLLFGPAATNAKPRWTWKSAAGDGTGEFRLKLDSDAFAATDAAVRDTAYAVAESPAPGTVRTLYVQERDRAGNWSASASLAIRFDDTKPAVAFVSPQVSGSYPTAAATLAVAGTAGGPNAIKSVTYRLGEGAPGTALLAGGAWSIPALVLTVGASADLVVTATDSLGNSATATLTLVQDMAPPAAPAVKAATPTRTQPAWTWSSSGGGTGVFRHRLGDGNFPADAPTTRDTAWSLNDPAAAGATYTLFVQERDAAGNWSVSGFKAVRFDDTRPTVAIQAPQASGTWPTNAPAAALSGTATGSYRIVSVTWRLDGGAASDAVLGAGGAWSIPSVPLAAGQTASVLVTATDSLGNSGEAGLFILCDRTAPPAPAFAVRPSDLVGTALASWTFASSPDPDGSGPRGWHRYRINGGAWTEGSMTAAGNVPLREGVNVFEVQQQDRALNWSPSQADSVRLDTRGPAIAVTSPAAPGGSHTDTASLTVEVKGTAVDTGSGLKEVNCSLSGATNAKLAASVAGESWSITPAFNAGLTSVTCTAVDNFDKVGTVGVSIVIDIPKPAIEWISFKDGMVTNRDSLNIKYRVRVKDVTYEESTAVVLKEGANTFFIRTKAANIAGQTSGRDYTWWLRKNAVFVDPNALGANDGSSWADAFPSFPAALASPKVRQGGRKFQLWMSKGDYNHDLPSPSYINVNLPKSGIILGGFDAAKLSNDTGIAQRDPAANPTILHMYRMKQDSIDGTLEMNGLEMYGTMYEGWNRDYGFFPDNFTNGRVNVIFRNIIHHGLTYAGDYWSMADDFNTVEVAFLDCKVLNDWLGLGNWTNSFWRMSFAAQGRVFSRNTLYTRESNSQDYLNTFFTWWGDDKWATMEFVFENSDLNYFLGEGSLHLDFWYPRADIYLRNTRVRGDVATTIHTEGKLVVE